MNVGSPSQGAVAPRLALEIQTSVMKKAMNFQKQEAQAVTELMDAQTKQMERSVNTNLGNNIDVRI